MLASSREIVENLVLGPRPVDVGEDQGFDLNDAATRNLIRAGLLFTAFGIAQLNDVGKICGHPPIPLPAPSSKSTHSFVLAPWNRLC